MTHEIFNFRPLRNLGPTTAYERLAGCDPVSVAPEEAEARQVDARNFWILTGNGFPEYPLTNPQFKVLKLPGRRIRLHKNVHDQWGTRLGDNASVAYADHLLEPK